MENVQQFGFPNRYKTLGIVLFAVFVITGFVYMIMVKTPSIWLTLIKGGILFSLLLLFACKEKVEDELTHYLRMKSLMMAVIFVVVGYIVSGLSWDVLDIVSNEEPINGNFLRSGFQALGFLLLVHLVIFRSQLQKR